MTTLAVRDTSPVIDDAPAPTVEVHQAGPEDIEAVVSLNDDLARHDNSPGHGHDRRRIHEDAAPPHERAVSVMVSFVLNYGATGRSRLPAALPWP